MLERPSSSALCNQRLISMDVNRMLDFLKRFEWLLWQPGLFFFFCLGRRLFDRIFVLAMDFAISESDGIVRRTVD